MIDFLVRTFVKDAADIRSPQVRQRYGTLSGGVGIALNLLLFLGKLIAGTLTASISITADAFNNLSDAGSSVVTLVGFRLAGAKADEDHPFGHGRLEYLSGLAVSVVILLVGLELLKTSAEKILSPQAVTFSVPALVILAASVCVKLWMSFFNRNLSRRIGSAAMAATATDSLTDAVATSVVFLSTLADHFLQIRIDGWAGVLVALFILRSGWGAAKDTLNPLLGQSPDPELVKDIRDTIMAHEQVVGIHDLVIHDYGPGRRIMSLHAEIPMDADIMEAHDVIDAIEREIRARFGIETSIHMDPVAQDDAPTNALRERVEELVKEIDSGMTIHDFHITPGPHHTNLIFDVVAPVRCTMSDEAVRKAVGEKIKTLDGNYFAVIQVDRAYVNT